MLGYKLGKMYELGEGIEKNQKQAFYWYKEAATLGHLSAQYKLARAYETGNKVVGKDLKTSYLWYKKVAE